MISIKKNVILAPFTTFGIGGPADFFVKATTTEQLVEAVEYAKQNNFNFFVLGTGANILIGDKGFRGLVIKNETSTVILNEREGSSQKKREDSSFSLQGKTQNDDIFLTVDSGCIISEIIKKTAEEGLSGLEHFAGIPSTVGGALWQNLHFLNPERTSTVFISEILDSAVILTDSDKPQYDKKTVQKDYFHFGYDYSSLHDNKDVVLSATFILKKEDPKIIQERIAANIKWREEKHPDYAWRVSAGSVFKKLEGYGAGRLIEKVGLKGKQIGGAQISPKHANFIVNKRNAKAKDVRDLIDLVQLTIKKELGLDLLTEISFVGEF